MARNCLERKKKKKRREQKRREAAKGRRKLINYGNITFNIVVKQH